MSLVYKDNFMMKKDYMYFQLFVEKFLISMFLKKAIYTI